MEHKVIEAIKIASNAAISKIDRTSNNHHFIGFKGSQALEQTEADQCPK